MNKLTKDQKDEFATSFAALALYDGGADITGEQINTLLDATGNNDVAAFYPIIFANFLSADKITQMIVAPTAGGGGGGGGGGAGGAGAAEEEEKEEEEEVEEAPPATDMFG
eukprot:885371_1